jgi:hypothetical protein
MSWHYATAGRRIAVALIALSCGLGCLGTIALAQNACRPEDEIFGGYAFLFPNGWGDLDYKINNIPNAFDASNTYYLRKAPNFGLLLDGSGHFFGGTTPPNLVNGSDDSTGVGYALGGVQYKYHTDKLSPFLRAFVGAASISPDCCGGNQWNLAVGGGGGLDLAVTPRFSVRLAQVDYIYSNYNHRFVTDHPTQWNSLRLAAGVVFSVGSYCNLPLSCSVAASPTPAEVFAGEPIKLNATGTNFSSKHAVNYGWATTGGRLSSPTTQATEIDTTGLAPGSYSVNATMTDPKIKKLNSASCAAAFIVKQPPTPVPPVVSCSVVPTSLAVGGSATVTLAASSPGHRPLTYSWASTGGQLREQGASATLTVYAADAGKTIAITGTVTDDRALSMSSTCNVDVKGPLTPPCVKIEDWGECTFEKDPKRPWRVDNDCKDVLDKLALRLREMPNGNLAIVGYTDEKEVVKYQTLGAQRSANVKRYLSTDGPTKSDPARIQPRQGGTKSASTHFYFIPEGKLCAGELESLGKLVDETKVTGSSRDVPPRVKKPATPKQPVSPSQ